MFTLPIPERWVRFEGVNTADGNKEVLVDFYKVSFDPAAEFDLINDAIVGDSIVAAMAIATRMPAQ